MTGRFYFVGVSTAGSSVVRLFPRWAELFGVDAEVVGRDIPLPAPRDSVRSVVAEIAGDPRALGGLVTTHKLAVFRHAGDLFAELDDNARACAEVSCIARRDGRLVGYAKDPITAGRALDEMIGRDYFATTEAHVLCLGAGGAGVAIARCLLSWPHPPARIVLTDVDRARLGPSGAVEYRHVTGIGMTDELVTALPPGSLVINATGLGKDRPGSPVGDRAVLPRDGVVWDLNYRGELEFLERALAQAADRGLAVHDGWRYFLHGWAEHLAEVFGVALTEPRFAEFVEVSEPERPRPDDA